MQKIVSRLKYYAAMVLFLLTSSILSIGPAMTAHATPSPKVFVCKYVGTPGVDERLQTGQNPIDVSENAIANFQGVGSYFNDAQGRSYVLAVDTGQPTPSVSECPAPQGPTQVTPVAVTFTEPTCDAAGFFTIPSQTGVVYKDALGNVLAAGDHTVSAGTSVTIAAFPADNTVTLTGTTTWSHTFSTPSNCNVPTPVTPAAVAVSDVCGTDNDTFTIPSDGNGITYAHTLVNGVLTVTATPDATHTLVAGNGFTLNNDGTATFSYTFTDNPCTVTVTPTTPTVTTAATCSLTSEVVTPPAITGVVWSPSGPTTLALGHSVTYTATPDDGYVFPNSVPSISFSFTNNFDTSGCYHEHHPKVTLCHATDSWKNPYVEITVSAAGAYHGHYLQHQGPIFSSSLPKHTKWGDIIPTFTYHSNQYSLNWTAEGQEIFNNGCQVPAPPTKVRPARVIFTNPTCENPTLGSYTIPDQVGVVYKDAAGNVLSSGVHNVTVTGPTTITITAEAANNNIVLKGRTTWTHTFNIANGCGGGGSINPNITVTAGACVSTSLPTGTATVTVNNPNNFSVDFLIDLGTQEQTLTVGASQTGQVTFTGLAAGTYSVTVRGNDDTVSAEGSVTIAKCPVTPPTTPPTGGKGGGQVLGASTSVTTPSAVSELANTGTSTILPTILAISMSLTAAGVMYGSRQRRNLSSHIDADLE